MMQRLSTGQVAKAVAWVTQNRLASQAAPRAAISLQLLQVHCAGAILLTRLQRSTFRPSAYRLQCGQVVQSRWAGLPALRDAGFVQLLQARRRALLLLLTSVFSSLMYESSAPFGLI